MFDIFDVIEGKAELENKEFTKKAAKKKKDKKIVEEKAEEKKVVFENVPKSSEVPEVVDSNVKSEYIEQSMQENKISELESAEVEDNSNNDLNEDSEDDSANLNKTDIENDTGLKFLENPITNHALVGRKKSVFNKYGEDAALFLGRVNEPDYEKKDIYFDSLDPQVVFVCGSRGSGKSYVIGVLAEELALKNSNVGMVVIDPVGVFWSMKHPNRDEREVKLLNNYDLEPKGLDNVFVFIPEGAKTKTPKETYDSTFTIMPSMLTAEDWAITFGIDRFSPTGLLLEKVLKKVEEGYRTIDGLMFKGKGKNYDINDLIYCLDTSEDLTSKERGFKRDSLRALISRFEAAKAWGIFSKTGTPLIEVVVPGQLTVIDVSFLDENVAALLVGVLARRVLAARKINTRKQAARKMGSEGDEQTLEYDIPPTWLFIDEAHTLIPGGGIVTPASKALIEYVKQGRQPGCSLVFATQQPSAIDTRVLSQVGTLICYKLVFDDDIKAVFKRMPTQVPSSFKKPGFIKKLEIGVPLIADRVETTSRAFVANIRPRMSQHEGRETQTAEIKQQLNNSEILENMVFIAKNKLDVYEELDLQGIQTLLKILNMKYKTDVDFEQFSNALISAGVKLENEKYYVEKDDETPEKYLQRIVYKTIVPEYDQGEIEGITKRNLGWDDISIKKVYRPIFKINYKVYNNDGSFVSDLCYIDPVKVEFLHFVDKNFVYSQGFNELRLFDADDVNILMKLPNKNGFDVDWLKNTTGFGEVKLKRVMDRFVQVGLARKEKRGIKNVYFLLKDIDIPKKPLIKILSSMNKLPVQDTEVPQDEILDPRISIEALRNVLGTLWGNIKIDDVETMLREEYMITNLDTKESVLFETYTAKKVA